MLTFKTIAGKHIVTVDKEAHTFPTIRAALEFVWCTRYAQAARKRQGI
jgi:hypothetical protein